MLAREPITAREDSPLPTVVPPSTPLNGSRKRKHATLLDAVASSPGGPSEAAPSTDSVVLPAKDTSSRPRLTISRAPTFVPVAEDSEWHTTDQIASNRLGFRYTHAGLSAPGSTLPYRTIETRPAGCVRVSWEDRNPLIKVTTDGLGLAGDTGFRSARCNVPVREGSWYMEVKIECGGGERVEERHEGAHVRLGWGRREASLNGPAGLDGYSYGYRDKSGEKITLSRPRPYGRPFGSGDVIGMFIQLPPLREPKKNDPYDPSHIKRERIPIEFKGQEYFESLEYPQTKEMMTLIEYSGKAANSAPLPSSTKKSATVKNLPERGRGNKAPPEPAPLRPLPTLAQSRIAFFVNGECQGVAFQDIYDYLQLPPTQASRKGKEKEKRRNRDGTVEHKENMFDDGCLGYYPFISLFNFARVRLNPGPAFDFPPPPDLNALLSGSEATPSTSRTWRPLCERYAEFFGEQWALDDRDEAEAKVAATQRAAEEKVEKEKAAQKEKRRLQAEARKRAKKAEEVKAAAAAQAALDDRFGPTATLTVPGQLPATPTTPAPDTPGLDRGTSPAPTIASSGDVHNLHSGYNSNDEAEVEVDVKVEAKDGSRQQPFKDMDTAP